MEGIAMRLQTKVLISFAMATVLFISPTFGGDSLLETLERAEKNSNPIMVELAVIVDRKGDRVSPTILPKDVDYTSIDKCYISGNKFRYEQQYYLPFSNDNI